MVKINWNKSIDMGIFKGKLDINKSVETVTSAMDKIFFTDEEKADHFIKIADKTVEFYGKTLDENTVRSKTRRAIAIMIIAFSIVTMLFWLVMGYLGKDTSYITEAILTFNMPMVFITVVAFFFGGYYMKNISLRSDRKEKEKKKE